MAYYVFADGELAVGDALIDERGFAYADGFFSTIGVRDGRILWADFHAKRLMDGASAFGFELDVQAVMASCSRLAEQMGEGMIKTVITRQSQAVRGYGFIDGRAMVQIKTMPSQIYQATTWYDDIAVQPSSRMMTLQNTISHRVPRLAGIKLIACVEQVFCHAELLAKTDGTKPCDGLIASSDGDWVCATMGNIFYQLDHQWYTPPVNRTGVAGVMRAVLMARFGIGERTLGGDELGRIDALFTTNAVRGITPIQTLMMADGERELSLLLPV